MTYESFFKFLFLSVILGIGLAFSGCATSQSYTIEEAPEMMVTSEFAPFYTVGPQQISGPDVSLRVDQRFRLLRREFGYSYVEIEDGRRGYIPNETFGPAPQRPPVSASNDTDHAGASPVRTRTFSPEPYRGPEVDFEPLPDLDINMDNIPPPILLDDVDPDKKPEFRL